MHIKKSTQKWLLLLAVLILAIPFSDRPANAAEQQGTAVQQRTVAPWVEFKLADKDKDGVPDISDKCPNIYAKTKDGCPLPKVPKVYSPLIVQPIPNPTPPKCAPNYSYLPQDYQETICFGFIHSGGWTCRYIGDLPPVDACPDGTRIHISSETLYSCSKSIPGQVGWVKPDSEIECIPGYHHPPSNKNLYEDNELIYYCLKDNSKPYSQDNVCLPPSTWTGAGGGRCGWLDDPSCPLEIDYCCGYLGK